MCKENKRDIEEIKPDYIEGLTFHYVDRMSEVLDIAITNQKVKNAKVLEVKSNYKTNTVGTLNNSFIGSSFCFLTDIILSSQLRYK